MRPRRTIALPALDRPTVVDGSGPTEEAHPS